MIAHNTVDRKHGSPMMRQPDPMREARFRAFEISQAQLEATALESMARSSDAAERAGVARNALTPSVTVEALSADPDDLVREYAVASRRLPAERVAELAQDPAKRVRSAIAGIPVLADSIVAELASDADQWVRLRVASRTLLKADIVTRLARDADPAVRAAAAARSTLPAGIPVELACDTDPKVRMELAVVTDDRHALELLATDPSTEVRNGLLRRRKLDDALLVAVARQHDGTISTVVAALIALVRHVQDPATLQHLAAHPRANSDVFAALLDSLRQWHGKPPRRVLEVMVDRDFHASEALALLARHHADPRTLVRIARHPETPPPILDEIASSCTTAATFKALLGNPNTPERTWRSMLIDKGNSARLARLVGHKDPGRIVANRILLGGLRETREALRLRHPNVEALREDGAQPKLF